ncbi:uncharacterized protein Dana_GF17823, isoform B [Drosophila ananassae]|uniref:Uncharacterized protein, isoform B n=1 Tax=Drosophila ananassae TaxID=7217 RepID=A0A0P8XXW2_DROAN|nr:uncharacterized protein LOC6500606 isoform X1 [Drosophila ananassae]KPU79566.1 uncharacterized protein Dana_GF17823, isoform B [Drosophila ananassae]
MNGPQQSKEKVPLLGAAPDNHGGDQANWPGRGGNRGAQTDGSPNTSNWQRKSMQYNSQPRMPDRRYSGPHRVWNNKYSERSSPYQRGYQSSYRNREQFDKYSSHNHNSHPDRQERDYPKRTDYHYSNNSNRERSPGRYRDDRYRERRYNLRQSEDNYHKDSLRNESSFHRHSSHRQEPSENNKASKADSSLVLDRTEPQPDPNDIALKERRADAEKAERLEDISKPSSKAPTASKAEQKTTSPVEKPSSHKPSDQNLNLSSGSPPTEPSSLIQVRPLTQLLKQEILAVTKEKNFNQGQPDRQAPTSPFAATASPSRLAIKPNLKNRRRTVSCNQGISIANNPSRSEQEASINKRIASLDKESLKYIINNSDTIYDEHLKLQARRRLRDEIRRQLKAIELDQPKDSPAKDLVEDEIVDAIKLPEQLLQEIEKCFGIKISEDVSIPSKEIKKEVPNAKDVLQGSVTESCKEIKSHKSAEKDDNPKSSKDLSNDKIMKGFSNNTKESTELLKDNNRSESVRKSDGDQKKEIEGSKLIKGKTPAENNNSTKNKDPGKTEMREEDPKVPTLKKKSKHEVNNTETFSNISPNRIPSKSTKGSEVLAEKHRPPLLPTPPGGMISISPSIESQSKQSVSQLPIQTSQEVNEILSIETSPEVQNQPQAILNECFENEEVSTVQENMLPSRMEIKRDSSSSPVIEVIVPEDVIDLLSSSGDEEDEVEEVSMEEDELEAEIVESPSSELEELQEPTPPTLAFNSFKDERKVSTNSEDNSEAGMEVDRLEDETEEIEELELRELAPMTPAINNLNDVSDYEKKRLKLKLQSMADNVVDSFEKLILPNLRASLSESYSRKHSSSLQSRLHFISCVVTSSEHNSRTFSKIEVANIQRNLKAADNQQAMEFLIREIVSVVNLQKQRLRGQEESSQDNASGEVKATPNTSQMIEPPVHRTPPALNPLHNSSPSLVPFPNPALQFPVHQSITPFPVGLPFLATDSSLHQIASSTPSSFGYPLPGVAIDSMELSDQVGQINEIDRRLLENLNRRTFLEEMIMKFQKEKSDLEMLSLELQTRRSMLLNSIIARSRPPTEAPPAPKTPPPSPTRESKRKSPKSVTSKNAIAKRTRSKTQKPKALSKVRKLQKKRIPKTKSKELKAQLQKEISEKAKRNKGSNESNTKARLELEESSPKSTEDIPPATKPKQSQVRKPKANGRTIPPLPPPPPPPEPIRRLSYDIPHGPDPSKPPPPPPERCRKHNPHTNEYKVGNISKGKLHNVTSPITQIRIHKKYVIAASEDGDIYLFHLVTHKLERKITKHSEAITNMYLCEEESLLYTTSLDGFLKKSAVDKLERVLQTTYFKEPLQSIDVAWGAAFIGSRWGNIFSYNVVTNKMIDNPLLSTGQSIIAVKATKEGIRKILLIGCKGNFVHMHDAGSGLLLRRLEIPEGLNVYSLLLSDSYIYCGTQKNEIFQFEFATGNLITKFKCGNGAVSMASYEDRYLLVGCYDGFIYVLDKIAGTRVGSFKGAGRLILALIVAGDKIVTSSKDNNLQILEVPEYLVNCQ